MSVITLLTDFGTADGYTAEMKGVLVRLAPAAQLVDLAHDVPPGDIAAGAYSLGRAWRTFPAGTVHLAVVDPGVGTPRLAIAATASGHRFVAPDNGLLTHVLPKRAFEAVALAAPAGASSTFHGRDVFAPAAAALARGEPLSSLGNAITEPVRLPAARLQRRGTKLVGTVVHVDRFGTLITNIPGERVDASGPVRVGAYDAPMRATFGDVPSGEIVAFIGSGGMVEIAVRDGRADRVLGLSRGAEVAVSAGPGKTDKDG